MDKIFFNVDCVFVYLDEILVYSDKKEQYQKNFDKVFHILNKNNFKISFGKCSFRIPKFDFLGFDISEEGLLPTHNKKGECWTAALL